MARPGKMRRFSPRAASGAGPAFLLDLISTGRSVETALLPMTVRRTESDTESLENKAMHYPLECDVPNPYLDPPLPPHLLRQ